MRIVRGRQVQDECRKRRVYGLWSSDVLGCGRCERFVDVLDVSCELKCTELEHGYCCLQLQRRIHRRERRDVLGLRRRQVQGREWIGCLFGLLGWDVLGDCRGDCVFGVRGLSGELEFGSVEYDLHVQHRVHRSKWWCVLGMCCRQVQGEQRERRVHGLCNSDVFRDSSCKRFVDVLGVSFECKCTDLELGRCCLFVQCWIHRREWRDVHNLRCWEIQGREWLEWVFQLLRRHVPANCRGDRCWILRRVSCEFVLGRCRGECLECV